ncbi:hypothetical protein [Actinoplanes sichuanensis]|uniref:PH domain-containing protein n=1 Tax=Actinoplanes sichuanensis TaxID=512349 RepID=A0ABW4AI64_9ACTN|nr:hypothetical protein [Actinoplanes sichuanensis]
MSEVRCWMSTLRTAFGETAMVAVGRLFILACDAEMVSDTACGTKTILLTALVPAGRLPDPGTYRRMVLVPAGLSNVLVYAPVREVLPEPRVTHLPDVAMYSCSWTRRPAVAGRTVPLTATAMSATPDDGADSVTAVFVPACTGVAKVAAATVPTADATRRRTNLTSI